MYTELWYIIIRSHVNYMTLVRTKIIFTIFSFFQYSRRALLSSKSEFIKWIISALFIFEYEVQSSISVFDEFPYGLLASTGLFWLLLVAASYSLHGVFFSNTSYLIPMCDSSGDPFRNYCKKSIWSDQYVSETVFTVYI